jgi:hypothetical protein
VCPCRATACHPVAAHARAHVHRTPVAPHRGLTVNAEFPNGIDLSGAFGAVVPRLVGRQFVGRSARPLAVGDLRGADAADVAAARDAAAAGGVLARLAGGRAGWDTVQPDQYPADHGAHHESAHAPRPRGLRQAHRRGAARSGAPQSSGRRHRAPRRIGMGPGAAAVGAVAHAGDIARRSAVWSRGAWAVTSCYAPAARPSRG